MRWRNGWGSDLFLEGRGRDLRTTADLASEVVADSSMVVEVGSDRAVREIRTEPELPGLDALVGARAGSGFRARLAELLPDGASGDPLQLLLDDIPGATLISGFAFAQWYPIEELLGKDGSTSTVKRRMTDVCTGFMAGSSGLAPDGTSRWTHRTRPVEPLGAGVDVLGWHELQQISEISMRRARRIDVWRDGRVVRVDAMFQDSSTRPEGGRMAVHEYTLTAVADLDSMTLTAVEPVARILPYAECPLAVLQVDALIGTPMADLRSVVLERLQGVAGCTHLNDALRSLADVPDLVAAI